MSTTPDAVLDAAQDVEGEEEVRRAAESTAMSIPADIMMNDDSKGQGQLTSFLSGWLSQAEVMDLILWQQLSREGGAVR